MRGERGEGRDERGEIRREKGEVRKVLPRRQGMPCLYIK